MTRCLYIISIAAAAGLMLLGARGDLWLDEVWSLRFAEAAQSPTQLITQYKHDNNHVLNTLYLYVLGQRENLALYRGLAVASGVGSLVALSHIAARWGHAERMIVLLLAGTSYPLLLYFSEARGYAPAVFFSLLGLLSLQAHRSQPRPSSLAAFWCSAILGVLAHLSFLLVFFSFVIHVIHDESRRARPLAALPASIGEYFAVPGLVTAGFWAFYARGMVIGGNTRVDKLEAVQAGLSELVGLPAEASGLAWPIVVIFALAFVALGVRARSTEWSFYGAILLLAPLGTVFTSPLQYFNYRYILVCFPFFYAAAARLLALAYRSRTFAFRGAAVAALGLYVAGQAHRLVPFFEHGRGSYQPILSEMQGSGAGPITVGSDHDFRNKILLEFYLSRAPLAKPLRYIERRQWRTSSPDWMIRHSLIESENPEPSFVAPHGVRYDLVKATRFSGNSGFSWFLYRSHALGG